jgi:hypothetical protein
MATRSTTKQTSIAAAAAVRAPKGNHAELTVIAALAIV